MRNIFSLFRRKLLDQEKVRKYILYAIGEIILVVVGILIALQVNNWNENRKQQERIHSALQQIKFDLAQDIQEANTTISYYETKDSLTIRFIEGDISADNYNSKELNSLLELPMGLAIVNINQDGYSSLVDAIDYVPPEFNDLFADLKFLFVQMKQQVDLRSDAVRQVTLDNISYRAENFTWYSEEGTGRMKESTKLEHIFENPYYSNKLRLYHIVAIQNLSTAIREFRHRAKLLYFEIEDYLGNETDNSKVAIKPYLDLEPSITDSYLGTYNNSVYGTSKIVEEDGDLYVIADIGEKFKMFATSRNTFVTVNGWADVTIQDDKTIKVKIWRLSPYRGNQERIYQRVSEN